MPLNFLDHSSSSSDHAEPGDPKDAKKDSHRQSLLVIFSVLGVVIAWFTYRSLKGGTAAATTTAGSASLPGTTTGTVAGSGMDTDAYNGFTSYLQNIQGQITDLANQVGTQANSTATPPVSDATAAGVGGAPAGYSPWSIAAVTGQQYQDIAIAESPYVASEYSLYKSAPTQANQTNYLNSAIQFNDANPQYSVPFGVQRPT